MMLRDKITSISGEEISISYVEKEMVGVPKIPKSVVDHIGVGVGDKYFYILLSDGSVTLLNENTLKERLGQYYDELLPRRIIDQD